MKPEACLSLGPARSYPGADKKLRQVVEHAALQCWRQNCRCPQPDSCFPNIEGPRAQQPEREDWTQTLIWLVRITRFPVGLFADRDPGRPGVARDRPGPLRGPAPAQTERSRSKIPAPTPRAPAGLGVHSRARSSFSAGVLIPIGKVALSHESARQTPPGRAG